MSNWISWNGGECPIKDTSKIVEVRFRNGEESSSGEAGDWSWKRSYDEYCIVAYRIPEEKPVKDLRDEMAMEVEEGEGL